MQFITNYVRGTEMRFVNYTRSLELCARMNYETENLDFIDKIKPGEVLYDLGACEGRFSLYAALNGIECYAFEPENRNFQAMLENISLNEQRLNNKLTPINIAVGAYSHQSSIKIAQPWAGGHQKVLSDVPSRTDLNFNFSEEQSVEVYALDEFVRSNNIPYPDFLKIDIDGSEIPFLQGAPTILQSEKLKSIIFELHEMDESYAYSISLLKKYGYIVSERYTIPNEQNLYNIIFKRG
jgi:FkbM family methyltransferase